MFKTLFEVGTFQKREVDSVLDVKLSQMLFVVFHHSKRLRFGQLLVLRAVEKVVIKCAFDLNVSFKNGGAKVFICKHNNKLFILAEFFRSWC